MLHQLLLLLHPRRQRQEMEQRLHPVAFPAISLTHPTRAGQLPRRAPSSAAGAHSSFPWLLAAHPLFRTRRAPLHLRRKGRNHRLAAARATAAVMATAKAQGPLREAAIHLRTSASGDYCTWCEGRDAFNNGEPAVNLITLHARCCECAVTVDYFESRATTSVVERTKTGGHNSWKSAQTRVC